MDHKLSKEQMISYLQKFFVDAGYLIKDLDHNKVCKNFFDLVVVKNYENLLIHFAIRNISSAFLPYDKNVLRIQIGAIDLELLPINKINEISVLIGVGIFNDKPILSMWNAFYFTGHKTNRSCYISFESMEEAINKGKSWSSYSDVPVLLSDHDHFLEMIDKYIRENKS